MTLTYDTVGRMYFVLLLADTCILSRALFTRMRFIQWLSFNDLSNGLSLCFEFALLWRWRYGKKNLCSPFLTMHHRKGAWIREHDWSFEKMIHVSAIYPPSRISGQWKRSNSRCLIRRRINASMGHSPERLAPAPVCMYPSRTFLTMRETTKNKWIGERN